MSWKRLNESEVKGYVGMLPARVVLEHDESDHSYRTYLETFNGGGAPNFQRGRYFYCESEAIEDFNKRLGRL